MNQGRIRVLALWLADVLCVSLVWVVVVNVYNLVGLGQYHTSEYLRLWPIVLVFTLANGFGRLYHGRVLYPSLPVSSAEESRRLALSSLAAHLLMVAFFAFSRDTVVLRDGMVIETSSIAELSRVVFILCAVLVAVSAQLFRDLVRQLLWRLRLGQIPVVIVGDGLAAARLAKHFDNSPYYGMQVVARLPLSEVRTLVPMARELGVKHLFVCLNDNRYLTALMKDFTDYFSYIEYIPTSKSFPAADAHAVTIGGLGGMEMACQRRMKLLTLEKSIIDRVLALAIFLCALPFFVIVPILIKLTSRGPVIYKARRLGKFGQEIQVWKFRSMYQDADKRLKTILEADPALKAEFEKDFKLKDDPRVTPLGRFLRKTSIDELPQLFNVFRGEMALVGPRPIVKAEVAYYGESYEIFSSVKPGITGLWQASGRSDCDYAERVALDVYYILNWSPWLDFWIVQRTVAAVLKMKGSY